MPSLIWQVSGPEGIFPLGCVYITYLRICLSRGKAVGGRRAAMLAPRSVPATPAPVAAFHGQPSSAVVVARPVGSMAAFFELRLQI